MQQTFQRLSKAATKSNLLSLWTRYRRGLSKGPVFRFPSGVGCALSRAWGQDRKEQRIEKLALKSANKSQHSALIGSSENAQIELFIAIRGSPISNLGDRAAIAWIRHSISNIARCIPAHIWIPAPNPRCLRALRRPTSNRSASGKIRFISIGGGIEHHHPSALGHCVTSNLDGLWGVSAKGSDGRPDTHCLVGGVVRQCRLIADFFPKYQVENWRGTLDVQWLKSSYPNWG